MNAQLADPPLIAVVDDEASVRKALGRLLRAAGFESRPFGSGREFLEGCRHEPPDCVVLDMHMPEMSGFEILKRMNESGLFLPTLLITADDEAERCRQVLDEGAVAWLRKPVDGPKLIQSVERAVMMARSVHAMNARVTAFATP